MRGQPYSWDRVKSWRRTRKNAHVAEGEGGGLLEDAEAQKDHHWVRHMTRRGAAMDPPSSARRVRLCCLRGKASRVGRVVLMRGAARRRRCTGGGAQTQMSSKQTLVSLHTAMAAPPAAAAPSTKPKITYFNYDGGRGEPIRIGALFRDVRVVRVNETRTPGCRLPQAQTLMRAR